MRIEVNPTEFSIDGMKWRAKVIGWARNRREKWGYGETPEAAVADLLAKSRRIFFHVNERGLDEHREYAP